MHAGSIKNFSRLERDQLEQIALAYALCILETDAVDAIAGITCEGAGGLIGGGRGAGFVLAWSWLELCGCLTRLGSEAGNLPQNKTQRKCSPQEHKARHAIHRARAIGEQCRPGRSLLDGSPVPCASQKN